nr:magnetosome protein Mad26-1 [Desulfobacteraceae bacterium]
METKTASIETGDTDPNIIDELFNDIKELEYMKQFLETENQSYEKQMRQLKGELDGFKISISSTHAHIQSLEDQFAHCMTNINQLTEKKEQLIDRNNQLHLQIKTISSDTESSQSLQENLVNEMNTILDEKKLILNRIQKLKKGLQALTNARKSRVPEFKKCHDIIRQMHSSIKQVHHKMEISMIFKRETVL